MRRGEMRAL